MSDASLDSLSERGLSVLRLSAEEWSAIAKTRLEGRQFSLTFPHEMAHSGKLLSLVLIVVDGTQPALRLAVIRSVQAVSTLNSRVVFDFVQLISTAPFSFFLDQVTEGRLRAGAAKLASDEAPFKSVSPKLGVRLLELILSSPDTTATFQLILSQLNRPKRFNNARAMQQDALSLALKAFGVVDPAVSLSLPGGDTALGTVRLQEDAVITHDARWIPGWRQADSDLSGRALFKVGESNIEVFTANKLPLEELFGVDMIYFNQQRGAIVMVQYKMMESVNRQQPGPRRPWIDIFTAPIEGDIEVDYYQGEEREWTVPIDDQFNIEMARMTQFDTDLSPQGPYRLNSGAFFLKLVKRNAAVKTSGILLSLGHLKQLIADGAASGPRGGLRISYRELDGHYLRSDAFVDLVRSGYIGTRGATTDHFQNLIEAALGGGRAVVAALRSVIERT